MLLILGLIIYLILTVFTVIVYKIGGIPIDKNVSFKRIIDYPGDNDDDYLKLDYFSK